LNGGARVRSSSVRGKALLKLSSKAAGCLLSRDWFFRQGPQDRPFH
jgi:hypothetical protein